MRIYPAAVVSNFYGSGKIDYTQPKLLGLDSDLLRSPAVLWLSNYVFQFIIIGGEKKKPRLVSSL